MRQKSSNYQYPRISCFRRILWQCCGSGMFIVHPGSGMFIPDPTFFHPGSRIRIKEFKYFNPKKTKKMVSKLEKIWSGLFIPDPDADFLPIPDPGSRGQKGTGSRIRICNTVLWFSLQRAILENISTHILYVYSSVLLFCNGKQCTKLSRKWLNSTKILHCMFIFVTLTT